MLQPSASYYIHKLIPAHPSLSFIEKRVLFKVTRLSKVNPIDGTWNNFCWASSIASNLCNVFVDERAEQQRLEELVYSVNNTCNSRIGVINQLLQKTDSNFYDYKVAANRSMHTFESNLQTVREDLDSVSNYYGIWVIFTVPGPLFFFAWGK